MKLTELRIIAREKGITGRSKTNKKQLAKAICEFKSQSERVLSLAIAKHNRQPFNTLNLQFFAEVESEYLKGLNDNQKEAVRTIDGVVRILSVAGSGKTSVLTKRTAYMINEVGIDADRILLTTFTNKASDEMEERLKTMLDMFSLNDLTLGTFHSIGYRLLREYRQHTDYNRGLSNPSEVIMQTWEQIKLSQDIIKQFKNKFANNRSLHDAIDGMKVPFCLSAVSSFKNRNLSPLEALSVCDHNNPKEKLYTEFYVEYEDRKKKVQKIDFDDMLFLTVRLLKKSDTVLKSVQSKWDYIMVDEAQDNNRLQYMLLNMISFPKRNIFLCGDDDQSLYGFRYASPQSFMDFDKDYEQVKDIYLPYNYRSNIDILETANKLIFHNNNRIDKRLIPASDDNSESVFFETYMDEDEEAEKVIASIRESITLGDKYSDNSCLFRTNAQTRAMEDKLIYSGIPYKLHGGKSFYDRKEIKDLIAYFKLAHNTKDNKSFKHIYNKPNRYLGNEFYAMVKKGKSHYETMKESMYTMSNNYQRGVNQIVNIIKHIQGGNAINRKLSSSLQYILDSGYREWVMQDVDNSEDNPILENIETLNYLLSKFTSLDEFINHLKKIEEVKKEDKGNTVHLMTIHKSKGLEFKNVYVLGVSESILPHARALEEDTTGLAIEEERRLCYVAVTRAEKACRISSLINYNGKIAGDSRFIDEMGLYERS